MERSEERLLRLPEVLHRTGMSRSWVYAAMGTGRFPAFVRVGARAIGWRSTDVDKWIASRTAAPLAAPSV